MSDDKPKQRLNEQKTARLDATPASPLAITGAQTLPASGSTPLSNLEGLVFAKRYRLERRLGRGGMGEVWRGQHLGLGVPVAIKLMHPGLAFAEDHVRRFSREAHALGLLAHPNVVRVIDVGHDHGRHFLVMEFLEGQSLGDYIERQTVPPPLAHVVSIVLQIASGLDAAHLAGVVHRDLKPDNVFLCSTADGNRFAKLVDFGLAHVDDARDPNTLTQVAAVAGTPPYMSPEQCRSLAVGPSTDLYALGCLLTELLQLTPPFGGNTPIDIVAKQMFSPPPALKRPETSEPVPELLERLRLDLLAKSPELRPKTGREVAERLHDAFDVERAHELLPDRSGALDEARTMRLPSWQAAAPSSPERAPAGGLALFIRLVEPSVLGENAVSALRVNGLGCSELDPNEALPSDAGAVVLDVGTEVQRAIDWLGAHPQHPPTLVILVAPKTEDLARLIGHGAAEVLASPPEIDQLVRRVARVLRRKR